MAYSGECGVVVKTQAMRVLERCEISYETRRYAVDPNNLDAVHVAQLIGFDAHLVYKTLVVEGVLGSSYLAVIPAPDTLDLKKLARAIGEKSVHMVPVSQLERLTGYVRGGVSPLATKKSFAVYFQWGIEAHTVVSVSAGRRGMQIILAGSDLIRVVNGRLVDITRDAG